MSSLIMPVTTTVKIPGLSKKAFEQDVELAMTNILLSLEKNSGKKIVGDGNFSATPSRVGRAYVELLDGMFHENGVKEILATTFPAKGDEMVTVGPVDTWSVCAHHFLPVHLHVWLAYIPRKKVLGLSKLARLAELLAKRPGLQEDVTFDIAKTLYDGLKPLGAACLIRGRHLCMEMRGVKKSSVTTTTSLQGAFKKNAAAKSEFLEAVRADMADNGRW
jgi:GTP cyclohydrolase I